MTKTSTHKGPWTHRLLVYVFATLFGVLVYWLLGFFIEDIGNWPGPVYQDIEKRLSDAPTVKESELLRSQIEETTRSIAGCRERQAVLRDSTSNSERTMNQLQKSNQQRGASATAEETKILADSQRLFLTNQGKYQEMNDQIAALNEQLGTLQSRQREVQKKMEAKTAEIQKEFEHQQTRHQLKTAAIKLAALLPLLLLAVWLFLKKRASLYAPLLYGFGLALLVKVAEVMHEHFPSRYFKYVLIVAALALVTRVLIYLLRAMAFPKMDWLLKQYRDAYEHFLCPICNHPIRRGPMKYLYWTRSSLKKLQVLGGLGNAAEDVYTCPVCATSLFEECSSCKQMRHALLPACAHCGTAKQLQPPPAQ